MNQLPKIRKQSYSDSILEAFEFLLSSRSEVFVIGQGLWSPWYVGQTMSGLEKKFGRDRVIDTPVSESACTGAGVGAALNGMRPIVVHPRMDFMMYAVDPIVNQAAKWSYIFGGQSNCPVTIRGIINRGGEQGAQHSQALHAMFAHFPGLRVVMPYSPSDARDLLVSSVLCNDPVIFIDDRWLYEEEASVKSEIKIYDLNNLKPKKIAKGDSVTIVAAGYSSKLAIDASKLLYQKDITCDIFDLRILTDINIKPITTSVKKTNSLVVIDGGWSSYGLGGEIIARVCESVEPGTLKTKPLRISIAPAPAPTATNLEDVYYPSPKLISKKILSLLSLT